MATNEQGIGTTPFYFVPKDAGPPPPLPVGNYYLAVRLHAAKVIYRGGWWDPVTAIAIATAAGFSGGTAPAVAAKSINTAVRKSGGQGGVGTGIQKLVVMPTPATMETLTLGANFTVTRRDVVNEFFELAQKEAFATALGLGAAAVATVKALATVIPGLITLFKGDAPEKEDALAVALEIPLLGGSVREGYYVALAAQGTNEEIPRLQSADQLRVTEKEVDLDGQPLRQASSVVLEVMTFSTREIDGSGELWVRQYRKTLQALQDLIEGVTPKSEKERVLSESLKGIYTVDALQAEDATFTQRDKSYWRKQLVDTYKQAAALDAEGGAREPLTAAAVMALVRGENERISREEAYERELQLFRQKWGEFNRPAVVSVEMGEEGSPPRRRRRTRAEIEAAAAATAASQEEPRPRRRGRPPRQRPDLGEAVVPAARGEGPAPEPSPAGEAPPPRRGRRPRQQPEEDETAALAMAEPAGPAEFSAGVEDQEAEGAGPPSADLLNLNTATRGQLLRLPRIGAQAADRIIAFREQNGPIQSIRQLRQAEVIPVSTARQIRALVRFR